MPLFEFECRECGNITEHFFHTRQSVVQSLHCDNCLAGVQFLRDVATRYSFKAFEPFFTYNITRDGSGVYVRDRAHLRELCREHGVTPHPLNDDPTASRTKMCPEGHPSPGTKFRKPERGIAASVSTAEQVRPMVEQAIQTDFGRKQP